MLIDYLWNALTNLMRSTNVVYTVNDGSLIFFTTSALGSHPKQAD